LYVKTRSFGFLTGALGTSLATHNANGSKNWPKKKKKKALRMDKIV
jgi:hypothetical protein